MGQYCFAFVKIIAVDKTAFITPVRVRGYKIIIML